MPKSREDFQPDVGGFLDGVSGEIVDAMFDIASGDYADKVMLGGADAKPPVVLTLTVNSPDRVDPVTQSWSVGSQDIWEIINGGKAIQNIKNPDKHSFRSGSRAMSLVEALMTVAGDGDLEKGQDIIIQRNHYMTEAAFYIGFNVTWATQLLATVQGGTPKPVPLPESLISIASAKAATKPGVKTAVKPAVKAAAAAAPEAEASDTADLDQVLVDNASGKSEKELKSFAVRNATIKANDVYMKAVVSGKKLRELEAVGTLTMDPESKTYL